MLTYDISERGNLTIYEYLYRCIKDDIIKADSPLVRSFRPKGRWRSSIRSA